MYEVAEAAKVITGSADDDAKVIFGANIDESLGDEVRITVVATGFDNREMRRAPSLAGDMEISPRSAWSPTPVSRRDDFRGSSRVANPYEAPFETRRVPAPTPAVEPSSEPEQPRFRQQPVQEVQPQMQQMQAPPASDVRPPTSAPAKADDDDFGIPAFIRRKMM